MTTLRDDLNAPGPVYAYVYLLHPPFFRELVAPHLSRDALWILADAHQLAPLHELADEFPLLHCATWSRNRTMHDKTILFPQLDVIYLTSANMTRGSWTLSVNAAVRVENRGLCGDLAATFIHRFAHAKVQPRRKKF